MSRLPRLTGLAFLVVSFSLATLTGCGESVGSISGEIKFQGKPIPKGSITFFNEASKLRKSATGPIENGKYSIKNMVVGEAKVALIAVFPEPEKKTKPPVRKTKEKKEDPFPAKKYGDPATSGLTHTVVKGEQTKNFDLQP